MKFTNILLIDDDADDREIFEMAMNKVSDNVVFISMSDAKEALIKLEKNEIHPDVIFLDLNMPVMNGQEFLVEIKKRDRIKEIPVIIFSTSFHPATINLTKMLGASDFITKPGKLNDLVEILKKKILG